jgi:hypothetical protein
MGQGVVVAASLRRGTRRYNNTATQRRGYSAPLQEATASFDLVTLQPYFVEV